MSTHKVSFLGLISVFLAGFALGGEAIPNWPAPATWSPARSRGVSAMDVTNPLPFIGLSPCRIADTRGNGFMVQSGPPSLTGGVPRNFLLAGTVPGVPMQCGIPVSAGAVSLNVTVTNTQGPGFILIYPAGGAQPTVSTLNYVANQTIANAAVVPLGSGASAGMITVVAGVSGTDLILDTNGYYYDGTIPPGSLLSGEQFLVQGSLSNPVIGGVNHSATGGFTSGIGGQVDGPGNTGSGVFGLQLSSTGLNYGVQGVNSSATDGAAAVYGTETATSGRTIGVFGTTNSTGAGTAGVVGHSNASTGMDSAGVLGYTPAVIFPPASTLLAPAGVRGESSTHFGVLGISSGSTGTGLGVVGAWFNSAGTLLRTGVLGDGASGLGVRYDGGLGGSGTKNFYEPHPTDPEKVIRYASLEGPEAGTYFRGRGQLVRGRAVIDVPESFRIVSDEEGLTAQVTPIGRPTLVSVSQLDLDHIVVEGSRDVEFSYLVQGVRRNYKDLEVMPKSRFFQPRSPQDRMIGSLSDGEKARLIANGTYNPDGTVNMETAERLGWVKMWADREAQAKAAASANAAARAGGWAERK